MAHNIMVEMINSLKYFTQVEYLDIYSTTKNLHYNNVLLESYTKSKLKTGK